MLTHRLSPSLSLACAAIIVAGIASPPPVWSSTDSCTDIDAAKARLACYDLLHGRTDAPSTRPDRGSVPASPAASSRESPAKAASKQDGDEVLARVVAAGKGVTGRRWFRLDSGQLWEQVTATRTDIAAGDSVRISSSAIGTYHLRRSDGSSRSSQVRRVE